MELATSGSGSEEMGLSLHQVSTSRAIFAKLTSVLSCYQQLRGITLACSVNIRVTEQRTRRYGTTPHMKLPRFTLLDMPVESIFNILQDDPENSNIISWDD